MTVLRVSDLTVRHARDVSAVRGVSFTVGTNEVLGIVGESGSGKTTLALALMGLLPDATCVEGSVRLLGRELLGRSDAFLSRIRGKEMSMVFQDAMSALTPVHTVGDQIAEAVRVHAKVSRTAARARAAELLGLVGLTGASRAYPHELSGGMRQRVLIAMALAHEPAVIIADEPTASLDATAQAQVLEVVREVKEASGAAIVLISHDLGVVAGLADRVMVMRAGSVVESGPVEQILRRSAPLSAARGFRGGPVVLAVDGLVKHYPVHEGTVFRRRAGTVRAVDGVGFDVREGETLALVGESGCGKSTVLMEIMRLARPQQGRVAVFGQDTARLTASQRRALRRDVQIVFQDSCSSLNPRMRVADILTEPLVTHGLDARVAELLEMVGLQPCHARRYPSSLSGGERQRVGIARALALKPRLLLLDEPISALDASSQADVLTLLESLQERLGLAYLFVAHDLAAVHRIAHRVAVMRMGRIVEIGEVER